MKKEQSKKIGVSIYPSLLKKVYDVFIEQFPLDYDNFSTLVRIALQHEMESKDFDWRKAYQELEKKKET